MTLGAWLDQRSPAPPERLRARIREVLGDRTGDAATRAPHLCVDAATDLLRDLLARPTEGRELALELLTVDALVTYAFEAAADDPQSLEARARDAMERLSTAIR